MKECEICGRHYVRKTCEYCLRTQQWEEKNMAEKHLSYFSKKLQKDLTNPNIVLDLKECINWISAGYGVFLYGSTGVGKTVTAAALTLYVAKMRHITRKGPIDYLFVSVPEMLSKLKSLFEHKDAYSVYLQELCSVDWLVLDDLGVQKTSPWEFETLYYILNKRDSDLKQTTFTSNKTPAELAAQWEDQRIVSRIVGMSKLVTLAGEDHRLRRKVLEFN